MKKFLFIIIPLIIVLVRCSSGDGVSAVKRWSEANDISDFQVYTRNDQGALEPMKYKPDMNGSTDSAYNAFFTQKMATPYDAQLFRYFTAEFYEGKLTFVDSARTAKIVSEYYFKDDSLFIIKSGNKDAFVAMGNMEELYRTKSYARYLSPYTGNDTVSNYDVPLNLEKVAGLAGFSASEIIPDSKDTLIWLNAKYVFK
ncbi:hypothetical protein [Prevotella sp. 10(H)]|uniref:hypothetical protein n=1 Tax=Prevotella sp. 10(H) TaxID=1158294 RepID=UPI000691D460|nr:hypothetical protein [Prevotella sp. 10(H)]